MPRAPAATSSAPLGSGWGTHGSPSCSMGCGTGERSNRTVARSTPETPSTMEWWGFEMSAKWPPSSPCNGLSRYSWFNQVQIAAQRPDATYVCARGDWRRLGYELAEDQWRRPIWILAPFTSKRTEGITREDR